MCGIGGIVMRNGGLLRPEELRVMAERIRHRGPDARGFATYAPGGRVQVARQTDAARALVFRHDALLRAWRNALANPAQYHP